MNWIFGLDNWTFSAMFVIAIMGILLVLSGKRWGWLLAVPLTVVALFWVFLILAYIFDDGPHD